MRARRSRYMTAVAVLCVATVAAWGAGDVSLHGVPGFDFVWSYRWWILGTAGIVAAAGHVIAERRTVCPACGARGFTRVVSHGGDPDDMEHDPWYAIRHCRACGIQEVECDRGVERLPAERWHTAAKRYARRDDSPPPPLQCRACGYDLRATPERCPECGTVPVEDDAAAQWSVVRGQQTAGRE